MNAALKDNPSTDDQGPAARFAALFAGLDRVYGWYAVPPGSAADAKGKMTGRRATEKKPVTVDLWRRHVTGKDGFGIGIVPIRDDGTCVFGAIDIDVYPVDHKEIIDQIERLKVPLIVCRTKSGGAHCYLFTSEPAPAKLMQRKLKEWAEALGYPGVEIFPKQTHLTSGGDGEDSCGSWINVPYNGPYSTRYAFKSDGTAMTTDEFFAAAEANKITPAQLAQWSVAPMETPDDLWAGAPPCLRTLAQIGFDDWQNNGMYNIAVYLKKRYGNAGLDRLNIYNERLKTEPLPANEVAGIAKSVRKRKYSYKCKDQPIVAHCDKDACRGCAFGVGQHAEDFAQYQEIDGALHFVKRTEHGPMPLQLCNFTARIEEDRKVDDGVTVARQFQISGSLANGSTLPAVTVPVKQLAGAWWLERWGAAVTVMPGQGVAHLMTAIQTVSAPVPERTVYAHLGWRKIDGRWLYLHGGGAASAAGPIDSINVEPGGELSHYRLPPVRDVKAAVKASLGFFDIGNVGIALIAAAYRAPLGEFCEIATSLYLVGASGVFKSAIAGAAQAHWGAHWNGKFFPGNWSATANSLEKIAFVAKDAMLVVDDFAPKGTGTDVERLHQTADRLLRAQGNRGGRGRMNSDGTLKETFWPRGIVVSTGEDIPKGHSLRARMIIAHVKKGDIDRAKLAALQQHAADNRLAEAMAAYVGWLASRADGLTDALARRAIELRSEAAGDHARTPDNIASLLLGIEQLLLFAVDIGVITNLEADAMRERAAKALTSAAKDQDEEQAAEEPAERFRHMIAAVLASGRGHLADRQGGPPFEREAACGWREHHFNTKDGPETEWRSTGDRIGWIEGDQLWLIPAASYACAEKLSREQNRSLGITERMLGSRLEEAGLLLSKEARKQAKKLRTEGTLTRAYHLSVAQFMPNVSASTPEPAKDFERNRPAHGEPELPM